MVFRYLRWQEQRRGCEKAVSVPDGTRKGLSASGYIVVIAWIPIFSMSLNSVQFCWQYHRLCRCIQSKMLDGTENLSRHYSHWRFARLNSVQPVSFRRICCETGFRLHGLSQYFDEKFGPNFTKYIQESTYKSNQKFHTSHSS